MEELLNCLSNFKLGVSGIDEIITELDNLSTQDDSYEWDMLIANYSKLRFLQQMELELSDSIKLIGSFRRFMEQIDKVTQHYLREINWDDSFEFIDESSEIKYNLTMSLNNNNPFKKLKYIIRAYDILVPIVEDFRREKFVDQIEDTDFIKTFKKRRLN
jgi:hypothetical protein